MGNEEHISILKQGAGVWNEWRAIHHQILNPDLSAANLERTNLAEANLGWANLAGANLRWSNLGRASLVCANLSKANLDGAFLDSAELIQGDLTEASLNSAILHMASLHRSTFTRANLANANLRDSFLIGSRFIEADLSGTAFDAAMFQNTDLSKSKLIFTSFGHVDLSQVIGLETVFHQGPSFIGIDTLFMSKGKIPEAFLRGCGVPESFVAYIPSLIESVNPIQFHTCFISFTEADDAFAEKLYTDLTTKGVNCWRWKENARWGKTLMRSVDEAIRVFDKVIVICSEHSLQAPVVIREIERALQKEDDLAAHGKETDVLFPIRLDDYVFDKWDHHRKADVKAKHIGDFRQWHTPSMYSLALDRLIRDLQT